MEKKNPANRIWEIDFLRGLAIVLMVGYHLLYDLGDFVGIKKFLGFSTDLYSPAWLIAQNFFAGLFVVLSGISSTFIRNNFRRFVKLAVVALLITAVTYLFDPASAILFGIIHCLAVSVLIYALAFQRTRPTITVVWGAVFLSGTLFMPALRKLLVVKTNWLIPLGLFSPSFASLDYFPLIPWFGIFLIGTALGKWLYAQPKSLLRCQLPDNPINWCGRHSLLIYLIHQPLILAILYLLGYISF